ncbi:MAG: radical SAM protein, partial [Bacteroidetes bacterium]|nr:radical SAM protein [Bacteroidota bacterium]
MRDKTPQLRLLVTDKCTFSCPWCHRGGEGGSSEYTKASHALTTEQIKNIVLLLVGEGISYIKISGGEPLIRNDLIEIIKELKLINGVKSIELVTCSSKLKEWGDSLCEVGLDGLTVSIDTLDKEKIRKYKGNNQEDYLERMIDGIRQTRKKGVPVKINTIPQRNFNEDEIIKVVEFAGDNGLSLKLIDLMTMNVDWWMERYMPLSEVEKILQPIIVKQMEPTFQPGGTGTPMKGYLLTNEVKLFMRDATAGTHYGKTCETCENFPCQDGLMALKLTCDGKLKFCLYRNDNLVDLLSLV